MHQSWKVSKYKHRSCFQQVHKYKYAELQVGIIDD